MINTNIEDELLFFLLVEIDFRRAWIEIQFFTFVDGAFHVRRWIVEPKPRRRRRPRAQMHCFPRYDVDSGIVLTQIGRAHV